MTTADSSNPYTPPASTPPETAIYGWTGRIEYRRAISFVFENPNWIVNVLWIVGCTLAGTVIPIVPALVILGYQFEVIEALLVRPDVVYPNFKFDNVLKYLVRGLYPFLVALLCGIVAAPVLVLAIGTPAAAMAMLMAAVGEDAAPVVAIVMIPLIICVAIVGELLIGIAIVPFVLRAGLTQDIGPAFNITFVKDFVRKMWREELLAGLFLILAAIVAQIVGLLLLCVGVFFTVAILQLTQAHLGMQLYRLYLLRGGEKIPLKPVESAV